MDVILKGKVVAGSLSVARTSYEGLTTNCGQLQVTFIKCRQIINEIGSRLKSSDGLKTGWGLDYGRRELWLNKRTVVEASASPQRDNLD